ncbi:MAG: hypothetical protein U9N86_17930, partial [Bacteroidota bacterium]|nr:hypothetical protein [Bacteroidota bacterium]
ETSTHYSMTGDGTSAGEMYVIQANSTGADFYAFDSSGVNQTAWSTKADPFSSDTNVLGVSVAYDFTNDDVTAMIIADASEQAYFRGSDASTISWTTEYSFAFTAGDLDNISSPPRTPVAGLAVVLRQGSNFEFATVPERVIALLLFALVFRSNRCRDMQG